MLCFRVLGPLEVERDELTVDIAGQRQRAVLSILLLHAGHLVTTDALVDALWGEAAPQTALFSLRNAISRLRKLLGPSVISTHPTGYVLRLEDASLDAEVFERLLAQAERAQPPERIRFLGEALALWRGPPYTELGDGLFAQGDIRRLEELRLTAIEDRLECRLSGGEDASLVAELEGLVSFHPHRERLRGLLMLALYRSGRQAEALDAYHAARRMLVDELGIEPGRSLQELHGAVLRQEHSLDPVAVPRAAGNHPADVVRALLAGRLVPVLGPDAALCPGNGNDPPADRDLADHLSNLFACPDDVRGSLPRVSEFVALADGVGPLYDELHALLDRDYEPSPVHRYLATLPPLLRARGLQQLLIVTTSYDETLEASLREAGEKYDVVSYIAHGPDRGKFVHVPADGLPRVVQEPNADTAITTDRVPVILKIHGRVDRGPTRQWESFVVSEDDYIDFLAGVEPGNAIPVTLAAKLRRSHFLFLGYGVVDWNLRVFLRRMWCDERIAYRSWAVQQDPAPLARDFWRHRDVAVVERPLDDYMSALSRYTHELAKASS